MLKRYNSQKQSNGVSLYDNYRENIIMWIGILRVISICAMLNSFNRFSSALIQSINWFIITVIDLSFVKVMVMPYEKAWFSRLMTHMKFRTPKTLSRTYSWVSKRITTTKIRCALSTFSTNCPKHISHHSKPTIALLPSCSATHLPVAVRSLC